MLNYSQTEENYIKAIYHLQMSEEAVSTNNLAEALETKPASVTDMLKKLQKKKLVKYKAYYGCSLTAQGEKTALTIIRRHRLWEYFLSQKLGFNWNEVHDVAEELEHVSSEKLINKLDAFLGFPRFDPHGDPIPDQEGNIVTEQQFNLTELIENKPGKVTQIMNQSASVLEMLQQKKISLGTKVEVLQKFSFDGSLEIRTDNKNQTHITKELAKTIFLKSL